MMSVYVEQPSANVLDSDVMLGVHRFVCLPAFVHSPQVNAGEGGATLVPLAGVRRAPRGEALHADLGNPVPRLAVQRHVATIEAHVPHAACKEKHGEEFSGTRNTLHLQLHRCKIKLDSVLLHTPAEQINQMFLIDYWLQLFTA